MPALIAGLALPAAPALAGEDDGSPTVREPKNCVTDSRAKITVSGDDIDRVRFYLDGKLRKTQRNPTSRGTFVFSMSCSRLSVGTHRGRAVISASGDTMTRRFTITVAAQGSPRFTG